MELCAQATIRSKSRHTGVTRAFSLFVCFLTFLILSCSSTKSRDDEDIYGQGTGVSLDELEYTEGTAPPPPEEEPPSTTPPPEGLPQEAAGTADSLSTGLPPTPVRQLRRRVLVLPFENNSDYRDQPYGEIIAQKLSQTLEGSAQVVLLDDQLVEGFILEQGITRVDLEDRPWTQELNRAFGVHAVITGSLAQLNVATTKSSVSRDIEVGLAIANIEARLIDASTGSIIRTYTGRNPLYKSKEVGEFNQERAVLRAIDIGVEEIAPGMLNSLKFLEWSARVVRIDSERVYIDAGQHSGLRTGDILDVYEPGEEIINPLSQLSLGWAPGALKGRIRISGFFGVDGAYGTPVEGSDFTTLDVVKISEVQPE